MNITAVCDRIRQDYARFPQQQSYELYADDVYFQDPLNQFRGVTRYREMIRFIDRWFQSPSLTLHNLEVVSDREFQTRWTLSWVAPLPWKPAMAIPGWTQYQLNEAGQIISHIDHWNCSRFAVLQQALGLSGGL